ncbi:hypothetical protein BVRB_2g025920 [Beta vulgaris subsp. vulgaris]|nr:hypothetical protein BVRB_2g025920 [Beta vulgaris subsp. vulgaris]
MKPSNYFEAWLMAKNAINKNLDICSFLSSQMNFVLGLRHIKDHTST